MSTQTLTSIRTGNHDTPFVPRSPFPLLPAHLTHS